MNRYNHSRIYKITDINYTECYIGSTTYPLSKRFYGHRADYKSYLKGGHNLTTSFYLFEKYGVENCKIELLENCNFNSKEELLKKEGEYIRTTKCINRNIPCRTDKEYYLDNKEYCKQYIYKYMEEHKDRFYQKYDCPCGGKYTFGQKSTHYKSQKHNRYLDSINGKNVE